MPKGSPAVMVIVFGHVFLKSVKHTQKSRSVPSSQNHAYIPKYAVRAVTLVTVPPVFRTEICSEGGDLSHCPSCFSECWCREFERCHLMTWLKDAQKKLRAFRVGGMSGFRSRAFALVHDICM